LPLSPIVLSRLAVRDIEKSATKSLEKMERGNAESVVSHVMVDLFDEMTEKTAAGLDPHSMDFTGREALAYRLGEEFAARLLRGNLLTDSWRTVVEEATSWDCPRCDTDCPRHKDEDGNDLYEDTALRTKVGQLPVRLPLFRCSKCRKIFSPLPTPR